MNPYWNASFFDFFLIFFSRFPNWITGDFAHDEIQILALVMLSISCCILGCFLVFRKMTMMANSLSHTILAGIVMTFLLMRVISHQSHYTINLSIPYLLLAAFISSILTYFFTQFLHEKLEIQEDASIGMVFTFLFAIGIILVTVFTRNSHIGVELIMGNIDAIHKKDLLYLLLTALLNISVAFLFFKELFLSTYDSNLAKSLGFSPILLNFILMCSSSFTITAGFRSVGLILILNLLVAPIIIAKIFVHKWKQLFITSTLISIISSFFAVAFSRHVLSYYHVPLSTGGILSTLYFVVFVAFTGINKFLLGRWKKRKLSY